MADERAAMRNDDLLEREREQYGGVKIGSAFLGWLTAIGLTVLLTAVLTGILAAIGAAGAPSLAEITAGEVTTAAIVSAIVVVIIAFVAYYAGGYVAGRMARFDGFKQGLAVWLWAIAIAIVAAIIGAVTAQSLNILTNVDAFPQIPTDPAALTTTGIVTAVLALLASLAGALLGGKQGTHWHRKVDRAGL